MADRAPERRELNGEMLIHEEVPAMQAVVLFLRQYLL